MEVDFVGRDAVDLSLGRCKTAEDLDSNLFDFTSESTLLDQAANLFPRALRFLLCRENAEAGRADRVEFFRADLEAIFERREFF